MRNIKKKLKIKTSWFKNFEIKKGNFIRPSY